MSLLSGRFAPLFLGVEVFMGALIPLFILSYPKTKGFLIWQGVVSVLVLIGIMTMRYIVMIGGQSFPIQLI